MRKQAGRVLEHEPLEIVDDDVWRLAYEACAEYDLSMTLLAEQIEGARSLRPPFSLASEAERREVMSHWVYPHGRLLAALAGVTYQWQIILVDELSYGFFIIKALLNLTEDLDEERRYLTLDSLGGVEVADARELEHQTSARKQMLWKESVRARECLAQGSKLFKELGGRRRRAGRRYVLEAVALLNRMEKKEFDMWNNRIELPAWRRLQVRWQARFGKF